MLIQEELDSASHRRFADGEGAVGTGPKVCVKSSFLSKREQLLFHIKVEASDVRLEAFPMPSRLLNEPSRAKRSPWRFMWTRLPSPLAASAIRPASRRLRSAPRPHICSASDSRVSGPCSAELKTQPVQIHTHRLQHLVLIAPMAGLDQPF